MMKYFRALGSLLLAVTITACGGGGGSAGTTSGGGSTAAPTLTLELVDSSGVATTTVGSTTAVYARATARSAAGDVMAGEVVTFTAANSALIRFLPASGTALTSASGIALVQVLPATSSSAGAGSLTAAATLSGTALTKDLSFQVPQGTSDTATSQVSDFVLLLDRSTLANAGTATVKLTVVAVDTNNNIVPDAAVTVSTDANTIYTPGSTTTNASGQYTGQIGSGTDKTDRLVTVTVTINGIVKQTTFEVTGSQIDLSTTPNLLTPGATSTLTARLTDSASLPIAGKTIAFSGDITTLAGRQATTNSNGSVSMSFVAPSVAGSYVVQATASGITKQVSVQVGTSASIPVAVIPVGAQPALAAVPNVLSPNTAGSTTNQSQVRFLFLDAQNQPIPNVRVRFQIATTGLGSFDSTLSTGTSTVYTNASGVATAVFIPGSTGSPTDGVTVRACYQATDFTSASQCDTKVDANLTVAAQALALSIGNDNVLTKGTGGTYIKKFVVTVADAAGRAVANAPVDISLDITHYGKGLFAQDITFPLNIAAANTYVPDAVTSPDTYGFRVSCVNEDSNRNGFVDAGENINSSIDSFGQPTLEPRRSDIVLSYVDPTVTTTNASGVLLIQVEYSQRFATWLSYRMRVTTNVAGSQGSAERAFVTAAALDDVPNGSFLTPPFGVLACNNAN
ncbi:MAG TPA: hypothetical protein VLI46_03950 [Ramlibacter sp.]|nr:hypothetical protein [Ramlibacter sp.]